MYFIIRVVLFIVVTLMSGCALFPSSEKYQVKVDLWKGASVNALIEHWGYPNKIIHSPGGNKVYVYHYHNKGKYPSEYHPSSTTVVTNKHGSTYVSNTGGYYSGGGSYNLQCTTWFEISKHKKVKSISFRGNDCVSY